MINVIDIDSCGLRIKQYEYEASQWGWYEFLPGEEDSDLVSMFSFSYSDSKIMVF